MKFLLVITALMPLMMAPSAFFPYISGKVVYFRLLITIVSILFFIALMEKKYFREQVNTRMRVLCKNPIFICLSAFYVVFSVSAFFAVNHTWAFYGSIERGEGVIGMLFFYGLFLFSLFLFQEKEWINFFKLSLIVSVIFFIHAVIEAQNGVIRSASFTGHPTYLAAYFIFIIFIVFLFCLNTVPLARFWKTVSIAVIPMSLIGILITKTRGALVGLAAGLFMALIYMAIFGKSLKWKRFNARHVSLACLSVLILFISLLVMTRQHPFWQMIPGLNRVAQMSLKDQTTQSRILTAKVALQSVDPREGNMDKLLTGWGPENFSIAWNKYYDPKIYVNDPTTLDRAHNKVLDTLVMNGIFGLIFYILTWFFAFKAIVQKGDQMPYRLPLLFFGVSYFVQNLFVFDSVVTYIPFFAFFSFLVFLQLEKKI